VLLLVDTSGSMEKMIDGTDPEANSPLYSPSGACTLFPGTVSGGAASTPNRWGTFVQAMTGTFSNGYRCFQMARNGGATTPFPLEYQINGKTPYDYGYYLPYHRPVAQNAAGTECVYAPWLLPMQGGSFTTGVGGMSGGVGFTGTNMDSSNGHLPLDLATNSVALFDLAAIAPTNATGVMTAAVNKTTIQGSAPVCPLFEQAPDGAIDAARDLVRFGVMTFDQDTNKGVGVQTPTIAYAPSTLDPFAGQWSYFPGWDGASGWGAPTGSARGWPNGCTCGPSPQCDFEVGARNNAAPLWEGRHVRFPDGSAPLATQQATNDMIQQVLLASRPYGATPLEGMFSDARNYFWNDPAGPYISDPYSNAVNSGEVGCRDQYVILITDGAPNLDLHKSCDSGSGQCPFVPQNRNLSDIVLDLANGNGGTRPKVTTFVIGFAVSNQTVGTFSNCRQLFNATTVASKVVLPPSCTSGPLPPGSDLEACCTLAEVAAAGGSNTIYFADTGTDLQLAMADILGQIATTEASRTVPIQSPTLNLSTNAFSVASTYAMSFDPVRIQNPQNASWPWSGTITRTRTTCAGTTPTPQLPTQKTYDDDFRANLDSATPSARNFLSVKDLGAPIDSGTTLRPYLTFNVDGVGTRGSQEIGPDYSALKASLTFQYLKLNPSSCPKMVDVAGNKYPALSAAGCAQASLAFATGQADVPPAWTSALWSYVSRAPNNVYGGTSTNFCTSGGPCASAFGAIIHSTPTIAPPPSDVARDDSYRAFTQINATRPAVLYVATIDGLLHAFDVTDDPGSNSATNNAGQTAPVDIGGGPRSNEMWSFVPPAVLPLLRSNFPGGQQIILDGSPAVKDVVFSRLAAQTTFVTAWHTALVAGFGQSSGGYYALDVTDPLFAGGHWVQAPVGGTLPATPTTAGVPKTPPTGGSGPHFLWQLTTVPTTSVEVQLFGKHSATPAITTVAYNNASGNRTEVGVAILPGGVDDGPFQGTCQRRAGTSGAVATYSGPGPNDAIPSDGHWLPRAQVRNWTKGTCGTGTNDNVAGRSVTIVRLDNGQIVKTFGRVITGNPARSDIPSAIVTQGFAKHADFDSPMTGTPAVYPAQVGAVTTKFYVSDIDGTMYKFDVSDPNTSNWTAELYFDAFGIPPAQLPAPAAGAPAPSTVADMANISEPIALPPVLSLDRSGNLTMHIATGDQDVFSATTFKPGTDNDKDDRIADYNFLYSLTEKLDAANRLRANVNWYIPFVDGERVTGPMAVFDSSFYFASFHPGVANACTNGEGRIWGVDFTGLSSGCAPAGVDSKGCGGIGGVLSAANAGIGGLTNQFYTPGATDPTLSGQLIPGVSIRIAPPCSLTSPQTDTFAGGTYMGLGVSNPLTPQLVWQAAKLNAGQTGGTAGQPQPTTLPAPKFLTSVDSWAAIVE
jgi:type IV pilus assembly protein PilY1